MKVELINTGTELLLGHVVNTHLSYLGQRFFKVGLRIERQICIPDGDEIRSAMEVALGRSDVVIVTGGLGPTSDDISREVAAELLGRKMHRNEEIAEGIRDRMLARGYEIDASVFRQAMVPEGGEVLPNTNGTAPGLYFSAGEGVPHLFLLPGPPRELHAMVEAEVIPRLEKLVETRNPYRNFKCYGLGESQIAAQIEEDLEAIPHLELGYCAGNAEVNVRCIGPGSALEKAEVVVREKLGSYLVSNDEATMEEVVVRTLNEKQQTVATAESCTGGLIANRITNVFGSSSAFHGGFVTYSNEAKTSQLGVSAELFVEYGAVSSSVAEAMAEGALAAINADHALAITGIAGPTGGSDEKPVGTVFIALASKGDQTQVEKCFFPDDRETFKLRASQFALNLLRKKLVL